MANVTYITRELLALAEAKIETWCYKVFAKALVCSLYHRVGARERI